MENNNALKAKILTLVTIAVAALSMVATPALSQELPSAPASAAPIGSQPAAAPVAAPAQAQIRFYACLQAEGAQCRLVAPTVGISVHVSEGDAIISYYVPDVNGWRVDRRESISHDMDSQVLGGQMSDDDAAYVFAELLSSHDLAYKLPVDASELRKSVGFPESAQLTPQDQVDILASHLQMSLGVSAVTADYLVAKLGLQILE